MKTREMKKAERDRGEREIETDKVAFLLSVTGTCLLRELKSLPRAVVLARAYCVLWAPGPCSRIHYTTTMDNVSTSPSPIHPAGSPSLVLTNHAI
jgi:hypothetical protein